MEKAPLVLVVVGVALEVLAFARCFWLGAILAAFNLGLAAGVLIESSFDLAEVFVLLAAGWLFVLVFSAREFVVFLRFFRFRNVEERAREIVIEELGKDYLVRAEFYPEEKSLNVVIDGAPLDDSVLERVRKRLLEELEIPEEWLSLYPPEEDEWWD